MDLSENEYVAKELMPATSRTLADTMGITLSYVYDIVESMRRKGHNVEQDAQGRYFIEGVHSPSASPSFVATEQDQSSSKATKTKKAKEYLASLEYSLKKSLDDMEPAVADGGLERTPGGEDLIIHRTDDHFGELNTNQHGDVIFDSEIAQERVEQVFDETFAITEARRDSGSEFDTAHLLLGGDIVTGESIYDGQPHEIDETLNEQIDRAADVYTENIRRMSDEFPTVQVVCQPGNHGRLGTGNPTNADGILYSALDKIVRESDMENVTFLQSDRSYYIDFEIRDWSAHLRHGHDSSLEHIGTSAGKQRWLSWLVDHDFDIAFRGHYHMFKEEPIAGRPVFMGGSILPQTEFEESHALSGRAVGGVHGSSDDYPAEWTERITFG